MNKFIKLILVFTFFLGNFSCQTIVKAQDDDISMIRPYACIGDECSIPSKQYALSGAYANMVFPNMPQTYAEVSWTLYVNVGYENGEFTTPKFSCSYDYLEIQTNMGVFAKYFYCDLSNITYTTSGRTMTISAPIYVEANVNGAYYKTTVYRESFTLTV